MKYVCRAYGAAYRAKEHLIGSKPWPNVRGASLGFLGASRGKWQKRDTDANGYSFKAKADQAEIFIYEDVGEGLFGGVSAKTFIADLKAAGKVARIDLRINSFGGDVFEGLAIYRNLVDHPARITAHIDGIAASIASVIAMAGDEIRISEPGQIMIHDASGLALGNAADMRSMADVLDTVSASIADVYVKRTGLKHDTIRAWMAEETWFSSAKALDLGFATVMAPNMAVAAKYDPAKHRFKHPPKSLNGSPGNPVLDAAAQHVARMQALKVLRARKIAPPDVA